MIKRLANVGQGVVDGLAEIGMATGLLIQALACLLVGRRQKQPVSGLAILSQAVEIGLRAVPIVTVLAAAIGIMVAVQGIYTLSIFGAESQVTIGIALSVTREFAPLITGVLVAGRSGSALAARIGAMQINEEISALKVMGISPVRYLVAPNLLAMMVMVPTLTWLADLAGLLAAGIYVSWQLGMSLAAYVVEMRGLLLIEDVMHGISKSLLFAIEIALIGAVNGSMVSGGAEGLGRMTTRAVVHSIAAIVVTDMLFVYAATR